MTELRAGDVVWHIYAEERWVLGRVGNGRVWPMGWPRTRADARDCILLVPATDAESARDEAAYDRAYPHGFDA